MDSVLKLEKSISLIEEKIGYLFKDKKILIQALIHRSFSNENKGQIPNERLEFLGDSVLGLLAADYLYSNLPKDSEGELSSLRSRVVEASACARYLQKLQIQGYILLGKGEALTEGRSKISILADTFESIMGAIYLDGGLEETRKFFLNHFEEELIETIGSPPRNFKAELQDYSQKKFQKTPFYKVVSEDGPEHVKEFLIEVYVNDVLHGEGRGFSKKQAEQLAAKDAIFKKEQRHE
jgi:ribonuclease-3